MKIASIFFERIRNWEMTFDYYVLSGYIIGWNQVTM